MSKNLRTITEAAADLGITPVELLDFDQSITDGFDHEFTQAEVDELAHVLAHLDEFGVYEPEPVRTPGSQEGV